jgi:hypothetical protein
MISHLPLEAVACFTVRWDADGMSGCGPSRHFAALRNLVVIWAQRTLASRTPLDLWVHGLVYQDVFERDRYCGFIYLWNNGTQDHERLGGKYRKYVQWT